MGLRLLYYHKAVVFKQQKMQIYNTFLPKEYIPRFSPDKNGRRNYNTHCFNTPRSTLALSSITTTNQVNVFVRTTLSNFIARLIQVCLFYDSQYVLY